MAVNTRVTNPIPSDIKEWLDYNPETGVFTHRHMRSGVLYPGQPAGTTRTDGRRQIALNGKIYLASRLAWFYVTGEDPPCLVDHINRNFADDRFSNLRLGNDSQNHGNRGLNRNNTSGFKGVTWSKQKNKWNAKIVINYKTVNLGLFNSAIDAAEAYRRAAITAWGEFAE